MAFSCTWQPREARTQHSRPEDSKPASHEDWKLAGRQFHSGRGSLTLGQGLVVLVVRACHQGGWCHRLNGGRAGPLPRGCHPAEMGQQRAESDLDASEELGWVCVDGWGWDWWCIRPSCFIFCPGSMTRALGWTSAPEG